MNKDEYYLGIAKAVAQKSKCLKKHYGAVIVNDDEIVSTGFNGTCRGEPHCIVCTKKTCGKDMSTFLECKSVHAEMNAIISASRKEMLGSTIYLAGFDAKTNEEIVTCPCEICLRLIKNAGIDKVVNKSGIIYNRDTNKILQKMENK